MKKIFYNSIPQGIYKPQFFKENIKNLDPQGEYLQLESKRYNGNVIDTYFLHTFNIYLRVHHMEGDPSNPSGTTLITGYGEERNISEIETKLMDLEKELQAKSLKSPSQ